MIAEVPKQNIHNPRMHRKATPTCLGVLQLCQPCSSRRLSSIAAVDSPWNDALSMVADGAEDRPSYGSRSIIFLLLEAPGRFAHVCSHPMAESAHGGQSPASENPTRVWYSVLYEFNFSTR